MYRFRIWSTYSASHVVYALGQDAALLIYNCTPTYEANRIDYKLDGETFWRYVDPEVLNRVTIAEIHEIDLRAERSRNLVYLLGGTLAVVVGVIWCLTWL